MRAGNGGERGFAPAKTPQNNSENGDQRQGDIEAHGPRSMEVERNITVKPPALVFSRLSVGRETGT